MTSAMPSERGAQVSAGVAWATALLADAGVASPRVDAELLAAYVLGTGRGGLWAAGEFTPVQSERFGDLVARRAARVPLQHLTGTAYFRHLELAVGAGVFVPRPETESLVEWGLAWLRARAAAAGPGPGGASGPGGSGGPARPGGPTRGLTVVDLCAGSGAIALSVATELAGRVVTPITVYAVERDQSALGWLRRNVGDRPVRVVAGDATDPTVLSTLDGQVDLVLSNPPYVPETVAERLPAEVREHDPRVAVFAGADGLAAIEPLIDRAAALLVPGGGIGIEHDESHAGAVAGLLAAHGRFTGVRLGHDLAGRPRFTTATRASPSARVADLPT
jgi:release factor glutamine methyltransferase